MIVLFYNQKELDIERACSENKIHIDLTSYISRNLILGAEHTASKGQYNFFLSST